ncbi:MAG: dihydrofolate reductase [Lachnospirales bacterium]
MLTSIVAIAENNVIGCDNKLIWHIPEDLKRFKERTLNKTVIVGRKTFENMPLLKKRNIIVVTRDKRFTSTEPNVKVSDNLIETLEKFKNTPEEVFVIGGAEVYSVAMKYINKLDVTIVLKSYEGDTFFPIINNEFELKSESDINESNGLKYKFLEYYRLGE